MLPLASGSEVPRETAVTVRRGVQTPALGKAGAGRSLETAPTRKRLYYAEHSAALLKTCFKYLWCPISYRFNMERNHRRVLYKMQIRVSLSCSEPLTALLYG